MHTVGVLGEWGGQTYSVNEQQLHTSVDQAGSLFVNELLPVPPY